MQRPTTSKAKRRSERLSAQISTVEWPYPENNSCEIEHFFTASMQRFPVQLNYLYPAFFPLEGAYSQHGNAPRES
jgi:hypothetical protein